MKALPLFYAAACFWLCACSARPLSTPAALSSVAEPETTTEPVFASATPSPRVFAAQAATPVPSLAAASPTLPSPVLTETPPAPPRDPSAWKSWPVVPAFVDPSLKHVYEYGLSRGNDPHAFSIFGDCQTRPAAFLGIFETDPAALERLTPELRETVEYFKGSFNREAPTTQDGTTPGALLWTQWHRGEFGCTFAETPVECELRIHRPSFVIIQVGTHFESRNTEYLRTIINQLLDAGVVPILATKADNREKDERINRDMALLASEFDLPLWNFWAAVSDLPDRGLYTRPDRPLQGDIYLTDEAAQRHRLTALEALNAVWRAVSGQ
jgi:hypothetical protein